MLRFRFKKKKRNEAIQNPNKSLSQHPLFQHLDGISGNLQQNLQVLQSIYTDCPDVVFRSFVISGMHEAALVYFEGLANAEEINDNVLTPLMAENPAEIREMKGLVEQRLSVSKVQYVQTFPECIEHISTGNTLLLIDRFDQGIILSLTKFDKRNIQEPTAESVVRGPREGFTETLQVNISMLRRIIRSPLMKFHSVKIGRYTQTEVYIAYIAGLAEETLIDEVKNRLRRIDIDGVLESGYIEEFIEDATFSPFPQLISTERPDVAASSLLEGRVAILTEGSPFALIAPVTLFSLMQASEDYYERFLLGTVVRWLRYFLLAISLLLPSVYVALLAYHQEMIPTTLLISIAASREQIPFPALVEAILMEIAFEALREAGIRLPKQVGSAVSIVGALIIGDAAVSAGLVSPPMVMVVAFTGIASFTTARYNAAGAFRILRFPLIILAGTLGLLGVMWGVLLIVIHLCTLRSFGVPYMSPIAPGMRKEWKDVIIRAPIWALNQRPKLSGENNPIRQSPGAKPEPSQRGE
ncbi:spore germination protein [Paenibacillus sp. NPDC056579]|uniref:spore germination protein n=1 Tax=Paenibacillus sp. NPDC056579 TaxID=3345871 RepID=UPI0036BFCF20